MLSLNCAVGLAAEWRLIMWTVVYISQNGEVAEELQKLLEESGILVKVRSVCEDDKSAGSFEILVPETEVEEAHNIILNKGL